MHKMRKTWVSLSSILFSLFNIYIFIFPFCYWEDTKLSHPPDLHHVLLGGKLDQDGQDTVHCVSFGQPENKCVRERLCEHMICLEISLNWTSHFTSYFSLNRSLASNNYLWHIEQFHILKSMAHFYCNGMVVLDQTNRLYHQ